MQALTRPSGGTLPMATLIEWAIWFVAGFTAGYQVAVKLMAGADAPVPRPPP